MLSFDAMVPHLRLVFIFQAIVWCDGNLIVQIICIWIKKAIFLVTKHDLLKYLVSDIIYELGYFFAFVYIRDMDTYEA